MKGVPMSTGSREEPQFLYSPAVRVVGGATFGLGTNLSWDAYQRALYNQQNALFDRQFHELKRRGFITDLETRVFTEQRNALVISSRGRLSRFGRYYSEIIKPVRDLPTYERLIRDKGSNEAILRSVGKTRAVVNRLSVTMGLVGRSAVVLNLALSVVVIVRASPEDRARVASRQGGALAGGAVGGWTGAWAGCAGAGLLASPSLVIPLVGEVTTGGACLVGGIVGGFGGGALGAWAGGSGGGAAYDYITRLEWLR